MLEASEEPFGQIEPFLRELQEKGVTSPHLWSMYIDLYENEAKSSRKPIDPAAVQVSSSPLLCQNLFITILCSTAVSSPPDGTLLEKNTGTTAGANWNNWRNNKHIPLYYTLGYNNQRLIYERQGEGRIYFYSSVYITEDTQKRKRKRKRKTTTKRAARQKPSCPPSWAW